MFKDFAHRQKPCTVDGTPERVILSRELKGTTIRDKESGYNGCFASSSAIAPGALVVAAGDTFLTLTRRLMAEGDKYCSLIKCNSTVTVQRYGQSYDAFDNPTGDPSFPDTASDVPAYSEFKSASLQQDDPGLLPSTTYTLILQPSVDIRDPQESSLIGPDRVILNGRPYQVDAVDRSKYPNLLHVQLCEDLR